MVSIYCIIVVSSRLGTKMCSGSERCNCPCLLNAETLRPHFYDVSTNADNTTTMFKALEVALGLLNDGKSAVDVDTHTDTHIDSNDKACEEDQGSLDLDSESSSAVPRREILETQASKVNGWFDVCKGFACGKCGKGARNA